MPRFAATRFLRRCAGAAHGRRLSSSAAALAAILLPTHGIAQAPAAAPAIEWSRAAPAPQGPGPRLDATYWPSADGQGRLGFSLGLAESVDRQRSAAQWGVHWRTRLSPGTQLTFSGWAPLPNPPAGFDAPSPQPSWGPLGARIELQWQSARLNGLVPETGAIGVQLQTGSRLMLRARHGGPFVYYRARF